MTTLRKLIETLDKNVAVKSETPWEELNSIFNTEVNWSEDTRLKGYYIKVWYCTDSYVGIRAYFLDDEFVFSSYQPGRKCSEDIEFVSEDAYYKVEKYLRSLEQQNNDTPIINLISVLDSEIPDMYSIEYNTQILHKHAWYRDTKVKVGRNSFPWGDKNYFHGVEIQYENGKKEIVDCRDLKFEYNNIN